MGARNSGSRFARILGALILTSLVLSACAEVNVVDITPDANTHNVFVSPPAADTSRHDLAILAVDFDPPLDYKQLILRQRSVALLVAIENMGTSREREVTVRAQLSTPEGEDLLLTQEVQVGGIAPGEIQIVRFEGLGNIPYHEAYTLEVTVDTVDGEVNGGNNHKAFDIEIHRE
jgi:hypothetical protein